MSNSEHEEKTERNIVCFIMWSDQESKTTYGKTLFLEICALRGYIPIDTDENYKLNEIMDRQGKKQQHELGFSSSLIPIKRLVTEV